MNRKELIDALAEITCSTKADVERYIAALVDIITADLKKGDNVSLIRQKQAKGIAFLFEHL